MLHNVLASRVGDEAWALRQLGRAGALRPMPVRKLPEISRAMRDDGQVGGAVRMAALRHRDRVALIDERGPRHHPL